MAIEIPIKIIADKDKLKYLYRMVELLRLEHNEKGKGFREGKMTEKDFMDYQKNDFELRNQKLFSEINQLKEKLDMFRNYNKGIGISSNLIESMEIAEDGKIAIEFDKDINITKI